MVARAGAGRGHRAREVLQRAGACTGPGRSSAAGGCARRCASSLAKLVSIGVPPAKLGVVLAFQTRPRLGRPRGARAGRRLVRGREAAGAGGEAHRRGSSGSATSSRGAGASSTSRRATRTSSAPAASGSGRATRRCADRRRAASASTAISRAGQIDLPVRRPLRARRPPRSRRNEIAALARVTRDADAALTILFAQARSQQQAASIGPGRGARRGARDRAAPLRRQPRASTSARLRRARARAPPLALGGIADELRREALLLKLRATTPSPRRRWPSSPRRTPRCRSATFPAQALVTGRGSGDAARPALPFELARPAIVRAAPARRARRALRVLGRAARRSVALDQIRCVRDRLPTVGTRAAHELDAVPGASRGNTGVGVSIATTHVPLPAPFAR